MRRFIGSVICLFIPSKKIRRSVRRWARKDERRTASLFEDMTNSLSKKMLLVNNDNIWVLPNGLKFYLPFYPWDSIQKIIVDEHQFYEQDVLDSLNKYIPHNAVILDIGANIGNHALYWASASQVKTVHCFEPIQETYKMLLKNIEINGFENIIKPYNIGLGDKKSSGEILAQFSNTIGATSIKESSGSNAFSLKIERLDDLDLGEVSIDFAKIDTEGFELKTLAGMTETLKKYRPVVFIESMEEGMGYALPKEFESNTNAIKKFFSALNYEEGIFFPPLNWLFVPKK